MEARLQGLEDLGLGTFQLSGEYAIISGMKRTILATLCALAASAAAFAAEVTTGQAETAVRNWIRKNPQPMTARFATGNGVAKAYEKDGKTLFHVVQLDGGGFVVTSGDTKISPIVAFSDDGEFYFGEDNPLVSLFKLAMVCKLDKAYSHSARHTSASGKRLLASAESPGDDEECILAERAWSELLSEPEGARPVRLLAASSQSAISDMRVEPIVKTSWGQRHWNGSNPNQAVFNYYTPNCPCGCIATAAAQVMRTMRFPDSAVAPRTFICSMESREEEHKMYGGRYNWDLMPYSISDATTLSEAQMKEIGKLTWDIGAAVNMNYTSGNSTTGMAQLRAALVDVFGFKSANLLISDRVYGTIANKADECAMFASLDAGLPVFGGIFQLTQDTAGRFYTAGGHCILFDGYGFIGAMPYVHMNCGYNGGGDVWYAFFTELLVNVSSWKYNYIYQIIYNVDSRTAGDVISGRVLDASGSPVESAEVTLSDASGRTIATTRSTSRGIWACRVPIGPGTNFVSAATATAASRTSRVIRQGIVTPDGSTTVIGNRWGVELRLEEIPLEQVETPRLNPAKGGFSGSYVSVSMACGTSGATIRYTVDGSEPTATSTKYTAEIRVSGTTTIRARAFKDGMRPSETVIVVYEQNVFKGASDIAGALDCADSSLAFSSSVSYSFRGKTTYLDAQKVSECVYGQAQETYDGVDALMLKARPYSTGFSRMWSAVTELSMVVQGTGLLKFKYKTQKNGGRYSGVNFNCYVNDVKLVSANASDSGEVEWKGAVVAVPGTGVNTIMWTASLDSTFVSNPSSLDDIRAAVVLDDIEWIPGPVAKHTVKYNLNGDESGLASPDGSTGYTGEKVSVPVDAGYVRDGYVFGGWNTEPDGSGVSYWPKASFAIGESDAVLYARWCKIVEVPFDFASEGGVHSFNLAGFTGSKFRGYGTLPDWVGVAISDERGNLYGGSSRLGTVSFAADATLHLSVPANTEPEERLFSWGVVSETYDKVPVFACRQHGDASHMLDGLFIEGPGSIVAGTSAGLAAKAHYRDGTSAPAAGCTWEILSGATCAEVSSAGILSGKNVTEASIVTVSATYREGDASYSVRKDFVVLPAVSLGASLNAEAIVFRTGTGNEAWVGQAWDSIDGIAAARCGSCLNASPWLEFDLPKEKSMFFACRLSEGSGRNLTIYVDGQAVDRFISTVDMSDWLTWSISAVDWDRTIKIVYQWHGPRGEFEVGEDCAWIDNVRVWEGGLCNISLAKTGWHLVSFSVLPDDPSPENVFGGELSKVGAIADMGSLLWTPSYATLTELQTGEPYWINTTAPNLTLSVAGAPDPGRVFALKKGYNRIGYALVEEGRTVDVLEKALADGAITHVADDGSLFYPGGGLETMLPGKVYWVYAPAACTIRYNLD